ncbi:phosphate/phosphite/phosphonate ABC transporter substrate-binding protein [Eionea flava]
MKAITVCWLILMASMSLTASAVDTKSYSFGVVPQQSAKRLAQLWGPLLARLSRESGIKLHFVTAKNIPEFERRLASGEYDFAYMNPYHFTTFNASPGYQAVVKRKNQPISGVVVVHKDSPINSMLELDGKKMAFPAPAAFAATILSQSYLQKEGINYTPSYVSSHDSVYLAVSKGLFAAGGGVKRTLNNTDSQVKSTLRILWESKKYTPHAIASHPRHSDDVIQRLRNALVAMNESEQGQQLLASLKVKNGFVAAKNSDWDDVRGLSINSNVINK